MTRLESQSQLDALLRSSRTIAVVGLSPNPNRDSHYVSSYLQKKGYRIVGVNPSENRILGEPCYPTLSALPEPARGEIDLVLVFRRPEAVPPLFEEMARLGLRTAWLQLGVSSEAALATAERVGIEVVAEMCIRVVHSLYFK